LWLEDQVILLLFRRQASRTILNSDWESIIVGSEK